MSQFAPAGTVEGPARVAAPFGLFSVLSPSPGDTEERWLNGVVWEPITCSAASGLGPDCDAEAASGFPKGFPEGAGLGEADPFYVYGSYVCSPVGHDVQWAQQRAALHLIAREEAAVEHALWTGDLGNTPNLTGATGLNSGTALDPVEAIGILEDWLAAEYGSRGVIHMTRRAATSGLAALSLRIEGQRLVTALGTPVVAGSGYTGTSPAGAAPSAGESWIYASPGLFGYRSQTIEPSNRPGDLLNRANNDLHGMVERGYLLGWDPCGTAAVEMTLGCCS